MNSSPRCRNLLVVIATTATLYGLAHAGGIGVSDPPEPPHPPLGTSSATGGDTIMFHRYKVPVSRGPHANRDFDFLWSDTYKSRFNTPLDSLSGTTPATDLDRLGQAVADLPGANPFALNMTDIEIAYNMLASQEGYRDEFYNALTTAPVGFRVAQPAYSDSDRAHIDAYIYGREFRADPLHPQWTSYNGDGAVNGVRANYGSFPSEFFWPTEDPTRPDGSRHLNSVMIPGPRPWQVASTAEDRWTRSQGSANGELIHESMHAMNYDRSQEYLHLFASAAEVVTGVSTTPPRFEVDYTHGLTPDGTNDAKAYAHWQSFTAYLAFNWRGADTTKSGYTDDLLRRWSTNVASERTLAGLARRMSLGECVECNQYPAFAGLDSLARLQRLLHDWRVALYVNAPALSGGRYGFPTQFGFSPAAQLRAWQSFDGVDWDDNVSVPPVVLLGAAQRNIEQKFTERPAGPGFSARPLLLNMFGAEYFVFKADPSLSATQQPLKVRVHMPGLLKGRFSRVLASGACEAVDFSGRLFASVITYSQDSNDLYSYPEWATGISTNSAVLDKVNGDLVFDTPGFGAGVKAVVLVVSLEDGPEGAHTRLGTNPREPGEAPNQYAFEISVVAGASSTPIAGTSSPEAAPAWSPAGSTFAYEAIDATGKRSIFTVPSSGLGTATELVSGTPDQHDPAWSPRGSVIAFAQSSSNGRDLWIAAPGGSAQQLTNTPGRAHEPTYSPNGSRLAYIRERFVIPIPEDTTIVQLGHWETELMVRSMDAGTEAVLATFIGDSAMSNLRWSADGQRLFFYGTHETGGSTWHLYQMRLASPVLVARDGLLPGSLGFDPAPGDGDFLTMRADELTWTPNRNCTPPGGFDLTTRHLPFQVPSLRDTITSTYSSLPQLSGLVLPDARWSPDGTKIAYTSLDNNDPNIYVASATTNRAPVLSASLQSYYSIPNCAPLVLTLSATDADGDAITYQAVDLPAGAQLQSGNDIYWPYPVVGDHWLVARALDSSGGVGSRVIHLAVYDGGDCGGGGGGEDPGEIIPMHGLSDRMPGDTRLIGGGPAGPRAASSFLDGAESGQWAEHTARLTAAGSDSSGHVRTRVITRRPGTLRMDRARLLVVDHDPNTVAVAGTGGIAVGSKRKPDSVIGTPAGSANAVSGEELLIPAGTVLIVEWPTEDSIDGLVLDCAQGGNAVEGAASGVLIEVPDATAWQAAGHIHPRTGYDALAVSLGGASRAQITFLSAVAVREIAGYVLEDSPTSSPVVTTVECANTNPEEGMSSLADTDSAAVELAHGEGVTMWFDGPVAIPSKRRTLFLQMTASFTPEALAGSTSQSEIEESRLGSRSSRTNPIRSGAERPSGSRFHVPRLSEWKFSTQWAAGCVHCSITASNRVHTRSHGMERTTRVAAPARASISAE